MPIWRETPWDITHTCEGLEKANVGLYDSVEVAFTGHVWFVGDGMYEGQELAHINYCPYCGQKLEDPKGERHD